jgi:hypothetical protein
MRSRALALACVATVMLAAGCMGESGRAIEAAALPNLVLQPADLGNDFVRFDEGPLGRADFQPGPRSDTQRFGRLEGWKARYRRAGEASVPGPLVVVSIVDLFEDAEGAEEDLDAYRAEFDALGRAEADAPVIGDDVVAVAFTQQALDEVRFFTIAWRQANATASVTVQGFEVDLEDAVALVRKQQARLERAAED